MAKIEEIYVCSNCDAQSPKWAGRCPECGKWGTLTKSQTPIRQLAAKFQKNKIEVPSVKVVSFNEIKVQGQSRIKTEIAELDRVLGGGLVPASLILIGGEPGIGKSTLVLQLAETVNQPVLYVSGEESAQQIKMRLDRLELEAKNIKFLGETNIEAVCATILEAKPKLAIIDSIQTMTSTELPSEAGTINQVRVCTAKLLGVAKKTETIIIIIGHITKEGTVAGPKTLEHLVDTVLYLEGDRFHAYRLLRTVKNRFGSTNEVGVFDMQAKGLKEVKNPSEIFIKQRVHDLTGSTITATLEGSRVFLVEIQALVSTTAFGYPQRKALGFDLNRLLLLIAVLTRRTGLKLGNQDIHLNVTGGLKIFEPAADLAACLAIVSAVKNKPIDSQTVIFGEVGLGGEIRPVNQAEKRIKEAQKLGFKKIISPQTAKNLNQIIKELF